MKQINLDQHGHIIPMPQAILGCHLNGKPNFMALAWLTRVNFKPSMLAMAVNKANSSHDAILETGQFSINFPSVEMLKETDYTGVVSGKKVDKSSLFQCEYGNLEAAPLIIGCPLTFECELQQVMELPTNSLFVGEVVGAYTDEEYMTDGKLDIQKVKPFVLTMPDNRYWAIGECIGHAWRDGLELKK